MRKLLLSLLALSILSIAAIANAKSIRIGTEGAYPPWNNINTAGELEGAEIDYVSRPTGASFVFNNVFAATGGSGTCSACGAAGGGCA